MTSPLEQPDFTQNSGTTYKTNLDNAIAVFLRMAGAFSAQAQDTPDMTVHVNAGHVFDGSTLTEVAAQNTGTIAAPTTNDRIDRVVIGKATGAVSVITGTEATTPTAPAITAGNIPCAQVYLTPSTTQIANGDLTDERAGMPGEVRSGGGSFPNVNADVTATDEDMNAVLTPYASETVELGGAFSAGVSAYCERVGNIVVITTDKLFNSDSGSIAESSAGVIPAEFRPRDNDAASNVTHLITPDTSPRIAEAILLNDGTFRLIFRDSNLEFSGDVGGANRPANITFNV